MSSVPARIATIDVPRDRVPLAQALLIVPQSHYRLFDWRFQEEMYELFHRHTVTRVLHMVCTPVIITLWFVLLFQLSRDAAVGVAAGLVAYNLFIDRIAGLLTAPLVLASLGLAHALQHTGLWTVVGLLFVAGAVQAVSHGAEPLPPPWSGVYGFKSVGQWLQGATWRQLLALASASVLFVTLEVWASPRVWVLQMLHLLLRTGYRPELRRALEEKVALALEDSRRGWAGQAGLSPA